MIKLIVSSKLYCVSKLRLLDVPCSQNECGKKGQNPTFVYLLKAQEEWVDLAENGWATQKSGLKQASTTGRDKKKTIGRNTIN